MKILKRNIPLLLTLVLIMGLIIVMSTSTKASSTKPLFLYTTTANVNMRTGPGTNYKSLGILPKGLMVRFESKTPNGWTKISLGSKVGYVAPSYIRKQAYYPKPAPVKPTKGIGIVGTENWFYATTNVHLRFAPSTTSKSLAVIPKGARIMTTSMENGWTKIQYNGVQGYVLSKYFKQ